MVALGMLPQSKPSDRAKPAKAPFDEVGVGEMGEMGNTRERFVSVDLGGGLSTLLFLRGRAREATLSNMRLRCESEAVGEAMGEGGAADGCIG